MYGNYIDKHTSPSSINFSALTDNKKPYNTSHIEYPYHNLKQDRTYQVGFILADRYGRQSSVILSNNKTKTTVGDSTFIGDTVYSSYNNNSINRKTWPGDSLKVLFNNPIPGGTTGLYNGDTSSSDYKDHPQVIDRGYT